MNKLLLIFLIISIIINLCSCFKLQNINNNINNLNILKCDIWYFINEIVLYAPKIFLTNNYYNKTTTYNILLLKWDIAYVDNEILNLSTSISNIG